MSKASFTLVAAPAARVQSSATVLSAAKHAEIFAILKALSRPAPTSKDKALVADWLSSASRRRACSVPEFTALLYAARLDFAARHLPEHAELANRALRRGYERLTGRALRDDEEVPHLPTALLHAESEETRLFYETAFAEGKRAPLFAGPLASFAERLRASAFWNLSTLLWVLAAALLATFDTGRAMLLGAVLGVAGASLNEYTVHLGVGHASDRLAALYRRLGWCGRYAEEITLAHRVHHSKMLTDFRVEFSNEATRRRVEAYLNQEARKLVEARVAEGITPREQAEAEHARIMNDIRVGGYGVNGTPIGCVSMQVLALPYFLTLAALTPFLGGLAFFLTGCAVLSAFIAQSMYSHRYLHLSRADQMSARREGRENIFMLWFLRSPIGRLQVRRHYRHHQEKIDYARTVNGAIMSFNTADFLLRRGVEEAEIPHLLKMREEDFL